MDPDVAEDQIITNSVTIRTRETAPTTTAVDVMTVVSKVYKPLHVTKTVIAGTIGGERSNPSVRLCRGRNHVPSFF